MSFGRSLCVYPSAYLSSYLSVYRSIGLLALFTISALWEWFWKFYLGYLCLISASSATWKSVRRRRSFWITISSDWPNLSLRFNPSSWPPRRPPSLIRNLKKKECGGKMLYGQFCFNLPSKFSSYITLLIYKIRKWYDGVLPSLLGEPFTQVCNPIF